MVAGFTNSSKVRPLTISKMELYIREKSCIIRSKRLLDELFVFIYKNGRPEAASGYHDDLVMSFCQGLWVRDTALRLRQAGIDLSRQAVSHIKSTMSIYKPTTTQTGWKMKTPDGKDEDLNWLV